MRGLKLAGAVLAALLIHAAGAQAWGDFPRAFDLLLLCVIFNALDGDYLAAMLGGLAIGLVADALSGGLYGLHGFADTMMGYGTAFAARRLVIRRATSMFLLFSLVAACQQAVLIGLATLLVPDPGFPSLPWALVKIATTGVLGVGLDTASKHLRLRWSTWQRGRASKLR